MGPINPEHEAYVDAALKAGTMHKQDIVIVLCIATLLDKKVEEVQDKYMDASIAVQRGFRRLVEVPPKTEAQG